MVIKSLINTITFIFAFGTFIGVVLNTEMPDIDVNGYILYCPCMGRFGNQADHFLGTFSFAHAINRTLVLPPWVEYRQGELNSRSVPFDTYFDVDSLNKYHRVITMEIFMKYLAPTIWPPEKRTAFCYMERQSLTGKTEKSCNAKEGNPFGPFWNTFNVDFTGSEYFAPLNYDVHYRDMATKWNNKYPAEKWPVLAFTGAPASYPVQAENVQLHKYLIWSNKIQHAASNFIKKTMPKRSFIGIHLRNGIDWIRACEHVKDSPNLFAAAQCLGYRNEKGNITMEMCLPSKEIITKQIKRHIKSTKELFKDNNIKAIFVASDNNHMIEELNESLQRMNITAHKLYESNPQVDLAILGMSNYFIGNCVSSFSSFVKRERDVKGFPSSFWAFPKPNRKKIHEEL